MTGIHDRHQNQLLNALQVAEYDCLMCANAHMLVGKSAIIFVASEQEQCFFDCAESESYLAGSDKRGASLSKAGSSYLAMFPRAVLT